MTLFYNNKHYLVKIFLLSIFFVSYHVHAAGKRIYQANMVNKEFTINANLDDPEWKNIPSKGDFRIYKGTGELAKKHTRIQIAYDNQALYFRIQCLDPELFIRKGDFFKMNTVEIFVVPNPSKRDQFLQLIISPRGKVSFAKINHKKIILKSYKVAGYVGNQDYFIIESKIPFALLDKVPKKGEPWLFNVARSVKSPNGKRERSAFTLLKRGFSDTARFAYLSFPKSISSKKLQITRSRAASKHSDKLRQELIDMNNLFSKESDKIWRKTQLNMDYKQWNHSFKTLVVAKKTRSIRKLRVLIEQGKVLKYHLNLRKLVLK